MTEQMSMNPAGIARVARDPATCAHGWWYWEKWRHVEVRSKVVDGDLVKCQTTTFGSTRRCVYCDVAG